MARPRNGRPTVRRWNEGLNLLSQRRAKGAFAFDFRLLTLDRFDLHGGR